MLRRVAIFRKLLCAGAVLSAVGCFLLFRISSSGQQVVQGTSLKLAEYYTNSTQMKALLTGSSAVPQGTGRTLVKNAKRLSFQTNGQPELTVEAPECLLDQQQHTLSSSGPLKVSTADGKFLIEGVGFTYDQTNSMLYISNQVHTVVHPEILATNSDGTGGGSAPSEPQPPIPGGIEINSQNFEYAKDTGLAIYHDKVNVAGTNLGLTSDKLTLLLPMKERQLQSVTADGNVAMDYVVEAGKIHVIGEQSTYSTISGLARVTGNPQLTMEEWQGHGDELIIDRTNKIFIANGNAFVKFPEAEAGGAGVFGGNETNAAPSETATNKFIQIACDHYVRFTNSVVFSQDVHVEETTAFFETNGTMTCSVLTANFLGTNKLESLLAVTNVVIQQFAQAETNQFLGERAFYTASNSVMALTGNPIWRAGLREGKGDVLKANMQTKALDAIGHAWMKLPSSELGEVMASSGAGGGTNSASSDALKAGGTNSFAEVFSQEYSVSKTFSAFKGGVRVVDPQRTWTSREITIKSNPAQGEKKVSMVAEKDVVFEFVDERGQKLNGKCDTAYYDYVTTPNGTNDMIRLTGNPMLQTTNAIVRNDVILLDHSRGKLILPGRYLIRGVVPPSNGTNRTAFPKL